ncbi:DUF5343 domain-containing protein [Paraburkholderia silvatlantica]|uniref:DUF5343 domain-containing protein n=1 Tax=Paraburkholderia silvatlantica TaxID=321895 RepID=UPI00105BDAF4|nr:DUF5343 domain-containing protein [Paraburkholderia silvatlantica]TDR04451.1 hypothetical protein C7412_102362 [Paraburkholderia silvatlantica]
MASSKEKLATPPVISYGSFIAFLNKLRDAGTVPARIDKTVMPKASGSQQSGIIAALRFLSFIDETGKPKDHFKPFVLAADDARKSTLESALRESYAFLFNDSEFDLSHASTGQMTEKFRELGISGSTLTKTIAFFIPAAKECGIEVSPHVKAPAAPKGNGSSRKSSKTTEGEQRPSETGGRAPQEEDDPDVERFEIPLPGKQQGAKIIVPTGLDADDWVMLQTMLAAYIKRWKGFAPEEKE